MAFAIDPGHSHPSKCLVSSVCVLFFIIIAESDDVLGTTSQHLYLPRARSPSFFGSVSSDQWQRHKSCPIQLTPRCNDIATWLIDLNPRLSRSVRRRLQQVSQLSLQAESFETLPFIRSAVLVLIVTNLTALVRVVGKAADISRVLK
jgi:hypothetical protein